MQKKYQIFVSSTFRDLIAERQTIFEAILGLDHIPSGMEAFPANNSTPFDLIKKMIDDSDYYILIIGGRYGSLNIEGISYTEMEYDYAAEAGKYILCFVHYNPDDIARKNVEMDSELIKKLQNFIAKVSIKHTLKKWENKHDLKYSVVSSLSLAFQRNPQEGWVKLTALDKSNPQFVTELKYLRIELELEYKNKLDVEVQKIKDREKQYSKKKIIEETNKTVSEELAKEKSKLQTDIVKQNEVILGQEVERIKGQLRLEHDNQLKQIKNELSAQEDERIKLIKSELEKENKSFIQNQIRIIQEHYDKKLETYENSLTENLRKEFEAKHKKKYSKQLTLYLSNLIDETTKIGNPGQANKIKKSLTFKMVLIPFALLILVYFYYQISQHYSTYKASKIVPEVTDTTVLNRDSFSNTIILQIRDSILKALQDSMRILAVQDSVKKSETTNSIEDTSNKSKSETTKLLKKLKPGDYVVTIGSRKDKNSASSYIGQLKRDYPGLFFNSKNSLYYKNRKTYSMYNVIGSWGIYAGSMYSKESAKELKKHVIGLGFKDAFIYPPIKETTTKH